MTDKIFPSSKPNGGVAAPPAATAATNPVKTHLYPTTRPPPYRHRPYNRRRSGCRFSCCCCCIWSTITILLIILIASIVGCALYVLYRPHRPTFTISSLRVQKLNVTSSPDASSSHLDTLFNMTITMKNPNNHITFSYMPFNVLAVTKDNSIELGNGTLGAITMQENNATTVRVIVSASKGLDAESATSLRADLGKRGGVGLKILMDTKVMVKVEKINSKMVGIRVTCEGIKGVVAPKGGKKIAPVLANTSEVKCKVDLRIKIWKFTF